MKKQEFTPGPWQIDPENKNSIIDTSDNVFSKLICQINGKIGVERAANARLISAVTELLDSCQEYQNLLSMLISDTELWDLLEKKQMIFASQASLKMDLNRVERRIKKATK